MPHTINHSPFDVNREYPNGRAIAFEQPHFQVKVQPNECGATPNCDSIRPGCEKVILIHGNIKNPLCPGCKSMNPMSELTIGCIGNRRLIMSELDNPGPVNDNWGDECYETKAA